MKLFGGVIFVALVGVGASLAKEDRSRNKKFIDLTHEFNNETVVWPGRMSTFNVEFEGETPDGVWMASRAFCTSEHTSTHMDAPYHFHRNGRKLDEIPLEDFIDIPGVMIDIYEKVHRVVDGKLRVFENYVLTRQDILEWESKNGEIPQGAIVLLRTGWDTRWPNSKAFRGEKGQETEIESLSADNTTHAAKPEVKFGDLNLNFPGYDATAAKFLTGERNVRGVGSDAISVDAGSNSRFFPSHQIFAARSVWMLEMVANLHLLPPRGFNLWVVPFKIDRGTGAPTRVLARIN